MCKNIFSVITELVCAAGLLFLMLRRGFDWLGVIALLLDIAALALNLYSIARRDGD